MRSKIVSKAKRKLEYSSYDYAVDTELLNDYFDEACSIIKGWRKKTDDSFLLDGKYDVNIITYIVQSFNYAGLEGQSISRINENEKEFIGTPESNLKKSIPQGI